MQTASFNGASGLRNNVAPERLTKNDLVTGVNIDLDESGAIMRRKGRTKLLGGATHSLYSLGETALMVQSGVMMQFAPDGSISPIRTGILGTRVDYASIMDTVFWVDEHEAGIIDQRVARPWGVTPPSLITLTQSVGELPEGRYSLTATYVRNDGHESGARASTQIDVTTGGISATLLPSTDAQVDGIRIYMTTANGDVLYLYGEYDNAVQTVGVNDPVDGDLPLRTQFFGPPPAGQLVAFFAGRMYVAKDNFLFYSLPYEHELFDLRYGFIPFEDRITMVAPVTNGIFLGTTKQVNFMQGMTPEEFKTSKVYDLGVVEGTARVVKADDIVEKAQPDPCAVWLGKDGLCVGLAVGQSNNLVGTVKNLTAEKYAMSVSAQTGASVLKLREGTPHFVVSTT